MFPAAQKAAGLFFPTVALMPLLADFGLSRYGVRCFGVGNACFAFTNNSKR